VSSGDSEAVEGAASAEDGLDGAESLEEFTRVGKQDREQDIFLNESR
jgi:hypothetical protein